jgi:hypothetical protein
MRVIVTVIEGAAQELYAELARLPSRQRAERLRHLAGLGLALVRNPDPVLRGCPSTEGNPTLAGEPLLSNDAAQQRQDTLKAKLSFGLSPTLDE